MAAQTNRSPAEAIRIALAMGTPLSSAELGLRAGVSQMTAWRMMRYGEVGDCMRIGRGRARRFALIQSIGRHGHSWPICRIGEDGTARKIARLTALAGDNWHIAFEGEEPLYDRGLDNGFCEGWPWFLGTLIPEGYLGRAFAGRVAKFIGANPHLREWKPADFLLAALLYGADSPGNLVIGEHDADPGPEIPEEEWLGIVQNPNSRDATVMPSGSAGGEHAKFATRTEIVKYAARKSERWPDLLVAECLANETLRDHGISVASVRLVEREGIVFHCSERFDRTPQGGRRAVHSLRSVDGGLLGASDSTWPALTERMEREGLLSRADALIARLLWNFGRLIGNNDMHTGNLAFHPGPGATLRLAPVYDMLPMAYAPSGGILPDFILDNPPAEALEDLRAREAASDYWGRVASDERISTAFREIGRDNRTMV